MTRNSLHTSSFLLSFQAWPSLSSRIHQAAFFDRQVIHHVIQRFPLFGKRTLATFYKRVLPMNPLDRLGQAFSCLDLLKTWEVGVGKSSHSLVMNFT